MAQEAGQTPIARDRSGSLGAPWLRAACVLALGVFVVVVWRHAWLSDDAFITFRTVDHFVHGRGLVWNPGERVQAYTHPLWMFLTSAAYATTGEMLLTAIVLGASVSAGTAWLLASRCARTAGAGAMGVLLLSASSAYVDYSTSGLENPLTHLLLVLAFVLAREARPSAHAVMGASLLVALGYLSRPDAVLLLGPPALYVLSRAFKAGVGARSLCIALAIGALPLVAWELFSMFYYGMLVPNTALAKLGDAIPRGERLRMGVDYLESTAGSDPLLVVVLIAGLALAFAARSLRAVSFALGALSYLAYVVWIGGDFMQGRFLSAPFLVAVMLVVDVPRWPAGARGAAPLLAALPALLLSFGSARSPLHGEPREGGSDIVDALGIADEAAAYRGVSSVAALRSGRGYLEHPHVAGYLRAQRTGERVVRSATIGMLGLAAADRLHVVDELALADPLLARLPAMHLLRYRAGHLPRVVPEGYLETIASGTSEMRDPGLARFYAHVHEVVSGELWSWGRLRTAFELWAGRYDHLIDHDRYRYPFLVRVGIERLDVPRPAGTPWDDEGNVLFRESGLDVALGAAWHAPELVASLDHDEGFEVLFMHGLREVGRAELEPSPGPGLAVRRIAVPEEAVLAGYDRVRFLPVEGDARCSIGHLSVARARR